MKKALLLLALSATAARGAPGGSVAGSRHDFSKTGPEANRSEPAASPCIYCHTSHGAAPGLSNRPDVAAPQRPYESRTLGDRPRVPTGSSRTCLSCHDGTVAVSETRKGGRGGDPIAPGSRANLGTDLRTSHPVSMRTAAGGRVRPPPPRDEVTLDRDGLVQCTSCHDPHREDGDPVLGKFLVKPAGRSSLCLACHDAAAYGGNGAHAASGASLPGDAGDAFKTVAEAGCLACHAPHGVQPGSSLVVRGPAADDDSACLRCHAGGLGAPPVAADMAKQWSHAVPGTHDHGEGPGVRQATLPETSPGARRHAVCVDCHDPHAATTADPLRPHAGGALAGVWGIDLAGQRVEPVRYEYEICFKCHGDSANKPQASGPLPPETVRRAVVDANLRLVFGSNAASSHPVATPRRQASLPGLKPEWASAPSITCSDCHSSDGGGTRGPHGSNQPHLLALEYRTADRTPEGPESYALCYKCHDRETLLSPRSNFPKHADHVSGTASSAPTACATCHNAHGVSYQAGNPANNAHLIDFDVTVVGKSSTGARAYQDGGIASGSCNLRCHDHTHDGLTTGKYQP